MKISIFITSYNQKNFLIEAVESVLSQTLKPNQIIIVDDCSIDGSQEVIAGFYLRHPELIKPIYHKQNMGVVQVRLSALQAVKGDYVTYVDGDDRLLPTKIEKEAGLLLKNPDAQIAFSNNFYMTEDGFHTGIWAAEDKPSEGYIFLQTFARDFPRRSLFRMELVNYNAWRQVGFHDPHLKIYEDFDMRIRLTKKLHAVYYDEPLSEIRCHNKGLSKSKTEIHLEALEYIYRKNKHLLDDVSYKDRNYVGRNLGEWIANIAKQAANESILESKRLQAAKYLFRATKYSPTFKNLRSALRILMPL